MSDHNIKYLIVNAIAATISEVANDINYAYNAMSHSNPNTKNAGLFADKFNELRNETDQMASDMKVFIEQYAEMVIKVSQNYLVLDQQIADIVNK